MLGESCSANARGGGERRLSVVMDLLCGTAGIASPQILMTTTTTTTTREMIKIQVLEDVFAVS
eukprot:scaffold2911_cov177-Amphora_coffeaeformis.AAC.4